MKEELVLILAKNSEEKCLSDVNRIDGMDREKTSSGLNKNLRTALVPYHMFTLIGRTSIGKW